MTIENFFGTLKTLYLKGTNDEELTIIMKITFTIIKSSFCVKFDFHLEFGGC